MTSAMFPSLGPSSISSKIIPWADRILIDPIEAANVSPGGVHIPDNARERSSKGRVIAVGEKSKDLVQNGDVIRFEKFSGTDISIEGKQFKLLRDHEILCIERE